MVRHLLTLACLALFAISPAAAQTGDGYEQFVSTLGVLGVSTPEFALAQTALVALSAAPEIGGATFRAESEPTGLDFRSLRAPFSVSRPGAARGADLVFEFAAGTQRVDEDAFRLLPDLFPARESILDGAWRVFSGYAAVGAKIPFATEGLTVHPMLGTSVARLADRTTVRGADAEVVREALDGTLLDWSAWTLALIPAIEVAFERDGAIDVHVSTRASHYRTRTLARDGFRDLRSDDPLVSARVAVGGDFGVGLGRYDLGWRFHVGTQRLLGRLGDALPFDHYQDYGAALAISIAHLGLGPRNLLLKGTLLDGPDLFGWGIGIGLES